MALEFERRGLGRGEVISADAFQVYRGMDIGTGKVRVEDRRGVTHHLIDIVEPNEPEAFTVHRWLGLAEQAIEEVRVRGRVPIVVGGTHLYAKALLDGLFDGPGADPEIRADLEGMDAESLRRELERVDGEAAGRIHPNDRRRTVRALEVFRLTGRPISQHQGQWGTRGREDALLVVLEWETEAINRRINARVREMVEAGLWEEVAGLLGSGRLGPQAREALGYKQIVEAIEGRQGRERAIERIKIETRRFAKNQRTWLRRLGAREGCLRLEMGGEQDNARRVVEACLA